MNRYFVTRLINDGTPSSRVILFHFITQESALRHVKRIHKISDWRYVGMVESPRDDLDIMTGTFDGIEDTALLKRTGVDTTQMITPR